MHAFMRYISHRLINASPWLMFLLSVLSPRSAFSAWNSFIISWLTLSSLMAHMIVLRGYGKAVFEEYSKNTLLVQLSCLFGGLWRAWLSPEGESLRSVVNLRNTVQREVVGCGPPVTLTSADFFVWKTWSVSRQVEAAGSGPGPGDL